MDDKDRLAILALLCVRKFSVDITMDLNSVKHREGWTRIFRVAFEFLNTKGYLKTKYGSFEDIIATKGSEHPIQSLMRHRNDLPIKSGQIFCNPGKSKYHLDLVKNEKLEIDRLKYAFKLVFQKIPDLSSAVLIGNFCVDTANDMAKYVETDYQFIDATHDDIIKRVVKAIYIG